MLLSSGKSSYTLSSGGTYTPGTPIDINPESIGNAESSYRFVEPIGSSGGDITDYVSKTNGGIFDNLLSYPSALGIVSDFNLVYKSWVVDEIDAKILALGAGTVGSVTAGDGMDFSEITTSGDVVLGTPSTLTLVTTNALTATSHTHALSGVQAYLEGTGFVISTAGVISYDTNTYLATSAFNDLFDARFTTNFATSSLSSLLNRAHADLTNISGDGAYHLSAAQRTIAITPAAATHNGYLTSTDWSTFNSKLDTFAAGTGIDYSGGIVSTVDSEIIHNNLSGYDIIYHRSINDSGVANTDLWSASKIISYLTDINISFSDVTTNNASTTKHGFLPKLANDTAKYLRSDGAWITIPTNGDFLDSVIRMVVDNGFDPGATPTDGDRYIIMDAGSIHANFGTIDKKLNGDALVLGNNDLVQYVTNALEFRIAYDSSTSTSPVTVTVGTDKNGKTGHQWSYNITDDVWVDRGSIGTTHNSFADLNTGIGRYYHLLEAEKDLIVGITAGYAELNYLDGTTVTNTRVLFGDGTKITNDSILLYVTSTGTLSATTFNGNLVGNVTGNVSGSAATWTTARSLAGNSVDGSTDVPFTNSFIVAGTADAGLTGANRQFLGLLGTGLVKNTTTTGVLSIATAGVDYQAALTNPVTGTGTANYISKWSGASTQVNSGIQEDSSGLVGIGIVPGTYNLNVLGTIHSTTSMRAGSYLSAASGIYSGIYTSYSSAGASIDIFPQDKDAPYIRFGAGNDNTTFTTEWARFIVGGNFGIGITAPSYKLDVVGDINISTGSHYKINGTNLTNTDVGAAATVHGHGNITSDGKIGSTSGLPVVTTISGALTVGVTQTPQALTQSGATLAWNIANGYNARVTLTASITTFTWTTTATAGDSGVLTVIQDGTGGWTLIVPSGHLKTTSFAINITASSKSLVAWYYDGTDYFWNVENTFV